VVNDGILSIFYQDVVSVVQQCSSILEKTVLIFWEKKEKIIKGFMQIV